MLHFVFLHHDIDTLVVLSITFCTLSVATASNSWNILAGILFYCTISRVKQKFLVFKWQVRPLKVIFDFLKVESLFSPFPSKSSPCWRRCWSWSRCRSSCCCSCCGRGCCCCRCCGGGCCYTCYSRSSSFHCFGKTGHAVRDGAQGARGRRRPDRRDTGIGNAGNHSTLIKQTN